MANLVAKKGKEVFESLAKARLNTLAVQIEAVWLSRRDLVHFTS
jgi:hypothetical protein